MKTDKHPYPHDTDGNLLEIGDTVEFLHFNIKYLILDIVEMAGESVGNFYRFKVLNIADNTIRTICPFNSQLRLLSKGTEQ